MKNKLQWSESQLKDANTVKEEIQVQLNHSTEELKEQKERYNEVVAARDECGKNLAETEAKLTKAEVSLDARKTFRSNAKHTCCQLVNKAQHRTKSIQHA